MKKNKRKNVVISGYYGFDNFGDEAILGVLTGKLKLLGADVRVFSSNPSKTAKLYNVNSTCSFCLCQVFFRILTSDILVSGGGSLLQDATSVKSLIYYLIVIYFALFCHKKVIIFAQGLGPINNKFAAFLTKKALKKCTYVSVRDRKSKLLLKLWGVDADLVCDPLFGLILPNALPQNKVGVQLRSFKTMSDKFLNKLALHINKNFADKEIELFSFQDSLDFDICKKFETILKKINPNINVTLNFNKTSKEILENIACLDYMIAMRFHANLIALKYGIKTLALSYDIKVDKLAEEAQIPCLSMSLEEDYDEAFNELKSLESQKLYNYANSKTFDWSGVEENFEQ